MAFRAGREHGGVGGVGGVGGLEVVEEGYFFGG